uniref:Uncharacterized protein n=1 Tax=Pithovirus LCDPAC02 TaxID=2506601 RepID=A0A481YQB1_9VIRU|nr:MAG: hypothetical protein LCDPAC02_03490 [Pithovirus LCDPAC02]
MEFVKYSENSFALFVDAKSHKKMLKDLGLSLIDILHILKQMRK